MGTANGIAINSKCLISDVNIRNASGVSNTAYYIFGNDINIKGGDLTDCRYGVSFQVVPCNNIKCTDLNIRNVHEAFYDHNGLIDSVIENNNIYTTASFGINCLAGTVNTKIKNNNFYEGQMCGIYGKISNSDISENNFINMGIAAYASAYPSILIISTVGDNFIKGNRVRNSRAGHVGIRNDAVPVTPNIVSKNDLRYAAAAQVLSLHESDINDENFTL